MLDDTTVPDLKVPGDRSSESLNLGQGVVVAGWTPDCVNTSSNTNSFNFSVRAVVQVNADFRNFKWIESKCSALKATRKNNMNRIHESVVSFF